MKTLFCRILLCSVFAFSLCSNAIFAQIPCSLDAAWDSDGKLVADGSRIADALLVLPDGKLLVACNPFGDNYAYLKRFNTDGTQDMSYGTGGQLIVQVAERRTDIDAMAYFDGKVYLVGSTTTNIGGTNTYVYAAATTVNGSFINTFGTAGIKKFNSINTDFYSAADILVDANGSIFISGLEWLDNFFVCKLTQSGNLSASWDGDGIALVPTGNANHWWDVYDMAFDQNGQVVVTGKKYKANNGSSIPLFWNVFIARFSSNGSLDATFANGGIGLYNSNPAYLDEAKSIMVTPSNNYITAGITWDGSDYDYSAARVLHNGTLDATFGNAGWSLNDLMYSGYNENCLAATLLPDGRILQTGNFGDGDTVHFTLLMLNPDGTRDNVFASNGVFMNIFNQNNNSSGQSMIVEPNGKIYMGGYTRTCQNGVCGPLYMAISRYNNEFGSSTGVVQGMEDGITVWPNPVSSGGMLQLSGVDIASVRSVRLMDMAGRSWDLQLDGNGRMVMPELGAGVYLVWVEGGTMSYTQRMVVQR